MVRFAELTSPTHVIIENVRGIVHDRGRVLQTAERQLRELGYKTTTGLLRAEDYGVAQRRRRVFLVATRSSIPDVAEALRLPRTGLRSFSWACGDLMRRAASRRDAMDVAPTPNEVNRCRIEHLFQHNLFELPDAERPPCHRNGGHSYKSIYGRLRWDQPAQTMTTGFRSMGQGRFVHPMRKRTITPREAARLQFIPDFVDFVGIPSGAVAKLIGNAVPPKLTYGIMLGLLGDKPLGLQRALRAQ